MPPASAAWSFSFSLLCPKTELQAEIENSMRLKPVVSMCLRQSLNNRSKLRSPLRRISKLQGEFLRNIRGALKNLRQTNLPKIISYQCNVRWRRRQHRQDAFKPDRVVRQSVGPASNPKIQNFIMLSVKLFSFGCDQLRQLIIAQVH